MACAASASKTWKPWTRPACPRVCPCPSCGGPVCPDCGDAMATVLVPVPIPAPASITEQVDRLIAGYRAHRQEITGPRLDHARPRQPDQASGSVHVVLAASQSDCLRDMLADAI